MKTIIIGFFRDSHFAPVTVNVRLMQDIRSPRDAFKYRRRRECALRLPARSLSSINLYFGLGTSRTT